jgi:Domain of unknown function (DUF222)/HNH endonuclease
MSTEPRFAVDDENSRPHETLSRRGETRTSKNSVIERTMREELTALGEQIAEQAVHLDAAMHRLLVNLRTFDERGGWHVQGFQSCAHWLSWRVGWDLATARDRVRVAHQLAGLTKVQAALEAGELSYSKARAIARVATPQNEETLLVYAEYAPAAQLEKICQKLRTVERAVEAKEKPPHPEERYVQSRGMDDGMVCVKAVLRPEEAAMLMQVIQAAARTCAEGEQKRPPNRADGLMAVIQGYARGEHKERTPVELIVAVPVSALQPEVVVSAESNVMRSTSARRSEWDSSAEPNATEPAPALQRERAVSAETQIEGISDLAELPSGACVTRETARRLACDAGIVEVEVNGRGEPLSVGRRTRTIPAAIKRALLVRDKTCRFPGCCNRLFLDGHHIRHWADGGETSLANTCLLCTRCHARLHEHGYSMEVDPRGELMFRNPDGEVIPATGERPRLDSRWVGWPAIKQQNEGLALHAETGMCKSNGRPVNYQLAVKALLPKHQQEHRVLQQVASSTVHRGSCAVVSGSDFSP